jgi:hypothetical protein
VTKLDTVDMTEVEAIELYPGESLETIFKIRVNDVVGEDESVTHKKALSEIEHFADLNFAWNSLKTDIEEIPELRQTVECVLSVPPLTVVQIPLKLTLINESELHKLTIN